MKSAGVHDDTTLLLGLDGVVVDRVELNPVDHHAFQPQQQRRIVVHARALLDRLPQQQS